MGTTINKLSKTALAAVFACALAGCGQVASSETTSTSSAAESSQSASTQAATVQETPSNRETISQVALLQSLLQGDYYGSISIGDLKKHGDIGIGTFDKLNGELIMVDGVLYRAKGDGTVEVPADSETIPFSNVTFFDADGTQSVEGVESFKALEEILNACVAELGPNRFYFARVDGTFSKVNVRSEYAQEEPYKPLVEVLETDQTFFDYENVEGTVVALYCPDYMKELNNAGWHLHFVSKDGTMGGHVLDLAVDKAELALDATDNFEMMLPDEDFFDGIDFTKDRSEEVKKAETNE
ncbi:MAG: acetolactate decarboxylase [Atopobiaceae bacterium]|nr:acetolactate decarboxylase [Atopobiaceae bacterium]